MAKEIKANHPLPEEANEKEKKFSAWFKKLPVKNDWEFFDSI